MGDKAEKTKPVALTMVVCALGLHSMVYFEEAGRALGISRTAQYVSGPKGTRKRLACIGSYTQDKCLICQKFHREGGKEVTMQVLQSWQTIRKFEHAGFKCLIKRSESGGLAGYVILPKRHPYYGKGPWDIPESSIAQDGLSFSTPFKGEHPWEVGIHTHEIFRSTDFVVNKTKELAELMQKVSV